MKINTIPQINQDVSETVCHSCGVIDRHKLEPAPAPHEAKLVCRHCGRYIRWFSTKTPEEREASHLAAIEHHMSQKPATKKQVRYLKKLGYTGKPPEHMYEASQKIGKMLASRGLS